MSKKLARNVYVDGVLHEAGSTPDKDVAEQITNPKAWGEEPETEGKAPAKKSASSKSDN